MTTTPRWIEYHPVAELAPAQRNPKRHDLDTLRSSLARFGYLDAVMRDERTGRLIGGHGRCEILAQLELVGDRPEDWPTDQPWPPEGVTVDAEGSWLLPVQCGWASANDDEAAAALIVLNRAGEGLWANDELAPMLFEIDATPFGLEGTGFDRDELDAMLAELNQPDPTPPADDDEQPIPPTPADPVTKRGDVWLLGPHRLMCGDCRNPEDVATLLDGATINLAFTSPPYADRREYDATSGFVPVPPEQYLEWFEPVQACVASHLADEGSWFVNIKAGSDGLATELYVHELVLAHARDWGWVLASEFCWERLGIPGKPQRRFKNAWEPVYHFARGEWKFRPESMRHASQAAFSYDAAHGRNLHDHQGAVGDDWFASLHEQGWAYPSNRLPPFSGTHEATGHRAAFPVGLPEWFVRAYTDEGDAVYDPFVGSGSTILAANNQRRVGYGMEIAPAYCDVILARWQRRTSIKPVLATTGVPHDFTTSQQ